MHVSWVFSYDVHAVLSKKFGVNLKLQQNQSNSSILISVFNSVLVKAFSHPSETLSKKIKWCCFVLLSSIRWSSNGKLIFPEVVSNICFSKRLFQLSNIVFTDVKLISHRIISSSFKNLWRFYFCFDQHKIYWSTQKCRFNHYFNKGFSFRTENKHIICRRYAFKYFWVTGDFTSDRQ